MNLSCPNEYPNLIGRKCVKYYGIDLIIKYMSDIKITGIEESKELEIKYYDLVLSGIEERFISENYNTSNLDNGVDELIETEKMTITFPTTENQKNNILYFFFYFLKIN